AHTTQVHSGEEALTRITGAQTPSGIPVTITTPQQDRPQRSARSSRGRRSRPAQERRRAMGMAA
ncbi:ATP-dependent helicase, partial [Streptomyces sp. NPDC056224]